MRTTAALVLCVSALAARGWEVECVSEFARRDALGRPVQADEAIEPSAIFFAYEKDRHAVRLRAARGGYASFQLVVKHEKPCSFHVQVGKPHGVEVELFRQFYHHDEKAKTWIPDALVPARSGEAFDLPAKDNGIEDQNAQAFWVDVWVPTQAPPAGEFDLFVWFKDIKLPINVRIQVEDVTIPRDDALTADHNCYGIGFVGGSHPKIAQAVRDFATSDPCFRLIHAYHRLFYEHRGTFHQLGFNHTGNVHPAFAPELDGDGEKRHVASWDVFDRHYGPLLDGSAFAGTRCGPRPVEGVYTPINPEWPARQFQWGTAAYEAEFLGVVAEMEAHFREKGWTHSGFEMFFNHKKRYRGFSWDGDETRFPQDDAYFQLYGAWLHKALPADTPVNFRFRHDASWRLRGQVDTLAGFVDHWVMGGGIFSMYPELPKLLAERGDLLWIYGGTPGIGSPALSIADMPLRAWLMKAKGYVRWLSVGSHSTVPTRDFDGNTVQVYSGETFGIDGPIPSIRLKLERNALQDLAILDAAARTLDEEKGAEPLRGEVARVLGLELREMWRPDSPLKQQQPWEWSNASFAGNVGAGVFSRAHPDGTLWEKIRWLAFEGYARAKPRAEGVAAHALRPPPHPLDGYVAPAAPETPLPEPPRGEYIADLRRIAEICMKEVKADECLKIVPPHVPALLFRVDPRDRWAASDNYDVRNEAFDKVKAHLARIAHENAPYALDCNLWMVLTETPELRVHPVVRHVHSRSNFYKWAAMHVLPNDEMRRVLSSGQVVVFDEGGAQASVLAPLKADGKVVGFFEVCGLYRAYAASKSVKAQE